MSYGAARGTVIPGEESAHPFPGVQDELGTEEEFSGDGQYRAAGAALLTHSRPLLRPLPAVKRGRSTVRCAGETEGARRATDSSE